MKLQATSMPMLLRDFNFSRVGTIATVWVLYFPGHGYNMQLL